MNIDRLIKLLEMMSSDQDGEVLNAAKMASKLVKSSGKQWKDLLHAEVPKQQQPAQQGQQTQQNGFHPAQGQHPFGGFPPGFGFNGFSQQQAQSQQAAYQRDVNQSQYNAQQAASDLYERLRRQQEEIFRQQTHAQTARSQSQSAPPEPKIDQSIKERENKKRFWSRLSE